MSLATYLELRSRLAAVRAVGPDTQEEDDLLGRMDDAWWGLSHAEQRAARVLIARQHHPLIVVITARGDFVKATFSSPLAQHASAPESKTKVSRSSALVHNMQAMMLEVTAQP